MKLVAIRAVVVKYNERKSRSGFPTFESGPQPIFFLENVYLMLDLGKVQYEGEKGP